MSKARDKRERRRVSPETVKKNAASAGRQQIDFFNLPKGVEVWTPEKATNYSIDILPYEVAGTNHPDRIGRGYLWYKRLFRVHFGVGANKLTIVCPASIDRGHLPSRVCLTQSAQSFGEKDKRRGR